jgi:hypothetical protein
VTAWRDKVIAGAEFDVTDPEPLPRSAPKRKVHDHRVSSPSLPHSRQAAAAPRGRPGLRCYPRSMNSAMRRLTIGRELAIVI